MISRLSFYTHHAVRETFGLPVQLFTMLMITFGISVPLALLLGLTEGLIRQQERDFLKSPSAIEIAVSATGKSGPLTQERERELLQKQPGISAIIPDVTKVVTLANRNRNREVTNTTVRCTQAGDPLLAFYGADVLTAGKQGIMISRYLADALAVEYKPETGRELTVAPNQMVLLTIRRQEGDDSATANVELEVAGVADFNAAIPVAYLHREMIGWIDDYQHGRSVQQLGWPGYCRSTEVAYEQYLSFTKRPLQTLDELKLRAHGLKAVLLDQRDPSDEQLRTLHGCLVDHPHHVYRLFAEGADPSKKRQPLLSRPASEIEAITDADDIIVPWSRPLSVPIGGIDRIAVGCSFAKRWLKSVLNPGVIPFTDSDSEFSLRLLGPGPVSSGTARLSLPGNAVVTLHVIPSTDVATAAVVPDPNPQIASPDDEPDEPDDDAQAKPQSVVTAKPILPTTAAVHNDTVLVPAALIAHLHAVERGEATFDKSVELFVDAQTEPTYYQARVIAADIHSVPAVDDALRELGFAVQSQRTRVEEIRSYAETLKLIVRLVGGTVFVFGLFTLCVAMTDNTLRKRRSIGILRAMGAGRFGVAFVVCLRGLLIGLTAGLITWPFAAAAGRVLTESVARCLVTRDHLMLVSAISVGACLIGTVWPVLLALRATPLDSQAEGGRS